MSQALVGPDAPAPRRLPRNSVWSPERRALAHAEYETVASTGELLARLNTLPGSRALSSRDLSDFAVRNDLSRGTRRRGGIPAAIASPPAGPLEPVEADAMTIARWAAAHARADSGPLRLSAVNARRLELGLNPFTLDRRPP